MPATNTDKKPRAFFRAVLRTFEDAEELSGAKLSRYYTVARHTIRLRFATDALVPCITPALEHIRSEPTDHPDLTVCLWDSSSTGAPMPPPSWSFNDCQFSLKEEQLAHEQGELVFHRRDGVFMTYQREVSSDVLNMMDKSLKLALFWTQDAGELQYWESGAPLRFIINWWLRDKALHLVHAGAVGTPYGGVLLAGQSGTGKSSTALSCLDSELVWVSDDYCLLSTDPLPHVYSIFSSAKVDLNGIERFPDLMAAAYNRDRLDREKAVVFLNEHRPEKIVAGFPVRSILLPRITGKPETTLSPASAMEGLKSLAPSSIFQLPGTDGYLLKAMAGLVRQVPCYNLKLGTDLKEIPLVISRLLSEGRA